MSSSQGWDVQATPGGDPAGQGSKQLRLGAGSRQAAGRQGGRQASPGWSVGGRWAATAEEGCDLPSIPPCQRTDEGEKQPQGSSSWGDAVRG